MCSTQAFGSQSSPGGLPCAAGLVVVMLIMLRLTQGLHVDEMMTVALVVIALVVIAFGDDGCGGDGFGDNGCGDDSFGDDGFGYNGCGDDDCGDDGCGGESFVCQPGRLPACGLRWPETQS